MNKYTLYWLSGTREVVEGKNITDAVNIAGYGSGAIRALDFHTEGDNWEYEWNKEKYAWVKS